jgi:hypothetical protein
MAVAADPIPFEDRFQPSQLLPLLNRESTDALAGSLRGLLVRSLPTPLYEASLGWGHEVQAVRGLKWTGKDLPVHPHIMRGPKKQSTWRKIGVSAINPADTLVFDLRDVRAPETGRLLFTVFISLDARVELQQQDWEKGVRLFDASARARMRVQLTLNCEAVTRLEAGVLLLPEAVFRLRVLRSHLAIDNVVCEHLAGVGGAGAKVLGSLVKGGLREANPGLERELLSKAESAIVKAGDTKEVRLSLFTLLKHQSQGRPAGPAKGPAAATKAT